MSANFYDLLKYAATGQARPSMTYYDKMRASKLMGGAVQTLTGQPPLSFKSDGTPMISWSIKGNGQQAGAPTPDAPVMPEFVGTLDGTDWTIPITNAGHTTPVYLGEVPTVRRIKKLVLTGEEEWYSNHLPENVFNIRLVGYIKNTNATICLCTHYKAQKNVTLWKDVQDKSVCFYDATSSIFYLRDSDFSTVSDFTAYLADRYAAGTPVTVWYVLAEPETGIANEPLAKIGDYADELSSTDSGVSIPTAKGQNTLTVDTELMPSEMTINYRE